MWLERQHSPLTRACYRRDAGRLFNYAGKPLRAMDLADLQGFAQSLADEGLAPIPRAWALAVRAQSVRPRFEGRLAERVLSQGGLKRLLSAECSERDRALLNPTS